MRHRFFVLSRARSGRKVLDWNSTASPNPVQPCSFSERGGILNRFRIFLLAAAVFATVFCATPSQAQTVSIVSGNGQLSTIGYQQLVVKVTDNSGNPVVGATVNWTITGFA